LKGQRSCISLPHDHLLFQAMPKPKPLPLPTQERLQELFDYSVTTGTLYHLQRQAKGRGDGHAGRPISGRIYVIIEGQRYMAHRLVWCWMTGQDPAHLHIDHIDGNPSNNAWHNLRLADRCQNLSNCKRHKDNASGFKGVSWDKQKQRWQATICHQRKQYHLGRFDTPEEAHAAYVAAAERLHGEFARAA
jgi:hypothetical protein